MASVKIFDKLAERFSSKLRTYCLASWKLIESYDS